MDLPWLNPSVFLLWREQEDLPTAAGHFTGLAAAREGGG